MPNCLYKKKIDLNYIPDLHRTYDLVQFLYLLDIKSARMLEYELWLLV